MSDLMAANWLSICAICCVETKQTNVPKYYTGKHFHWTNCYTQDSICTDICGIQIKQNHISIAGTFFGLPKKIWPKLRFVQKSTIVLTSKDICRLTYCDIDKKVRTFNNFIEDEMLATIFKNFPFVLAKAIKQHYSLMSSVKAVSSFA